MAFTVSLAIIPLIVAVVVAPLLAGALDHAGTWPRRVGRVLMSVPLVVISGLTTFGAVCGLALLGHLAVLRGRGRNSEWLLLPLAPWLFVGIGPLSIVGWENARELELVDTFAGLIPPMLISVPALVLLTLFCRGRAPLWQEQVAAGVSAGTSFLGVVVVPALPLAAFLGGAMVLINVQSLLWPLLVGTDRDGATAPVALVRELSRYGQSEVSVGFVTPFAVVIVALLALGALQVGYLDRLAITTDRARRRATSPPGTH